jgi:hypothetical protein
MLSIFKTLQKSGVCSFTLLPNDTTQSLLDYTNPAVITEEEDADAQDHRVDTYAFQFSPTIDQIKSAIATHGCVLALLRIGSEWWTPSWSASDILPLRPPQTIVGGHFVVLYGYDEKYIYFHNSWSDKWGQQGNGYFGIDYLPFVNEIGTAVDTTLGRFQNDMYFGTANLDVYSLQKFLVNKGYGTFTPTGLFGGKTLASVIVYQKAHNITPAIGRCGPVTRGYINTEYAQTS